MDIKQTLDMAMQEELKQRKNAGLWPGCIDTGNQAVVRTLAREKDILSQAGERLKHQLMG